MPKKKPVHAMDRKSAHLHIVAKKNVRFNKKTLFDDVELLNNCVPEVNLKDIDTSVTLWGKKLNAPIVIAGMTGGAPGTDKINRALAAAAQRFGLGFGVGSQKRAIVHKKFRYTYQVRDVAPDVLLLGNLGAAQFVSDFKPQVAAEAVEMIGADVLALHLNPAQEAVQPEGDTNFVGVLDAIHSITSKFKFPVIAKEVGAGISRSAAQKLIDAGVKGIDVGGSGGTSWTAVEYYRSKAPYGLTYWDWGIPTAAAVVQCSGLGVPVISTGGMRSGLHLAKAITLGASAGGFAFPALDSFNQKNIDKFLTKLVQEFRIAMFLTGSPTVQHLKKAEKVVTGQLRDWI